MAIVKCHECGRDVSTEAVVCPGCGAPPRVDPGAKPQATTTTTQKIAWLCIGIGLAAAAWMEYMDFNRTINALASLMIMGGLYGNLVKLAAAENLADNKKQ